MKRTEALNAWDKLPENIRVALVANNLISLKPDERIALYTTICEAKGLDPATRPFEFIMLNTKLTMYARKECGDQLRERNGVSVEIVSAQVQGSSYVVHVRAKNAEGRIEDDIGATSISEPEFISVQIQGSTKPVKQPNPRHGKQMDGTDCANAMMKAVTKGKRRVTLAICGLGMFDESEIEAIAEAEKNKAPTYEEVQRIAARVRELRETAAKGPKSEAQALIREACALEATILDLPGSGHTTDEPKTEPVKAPETVAAPSTPKPEEKPAGEAPTHSAPVNPEPVKSAPVPEQPAPAAQAPAASTDGNSPWREHVVRIIPHKSFKGKKLGDIADAPNPNPAHPPLLRVIYDNWVLKFADEIAKNADKKADAEAVTAAVKELGL